MYLHRARATVLVQGLLVAVGGCASVSPVRGGRSPELEQNMVELRALNAGHLRQIEELENRIFILEDQLEDQRLAAASRRARSQPGKGPLAASRSKRIGDPALDGSPLIAAAAASSSSVSSSDSEDTAVEYAGEAALSSRRNRMRPVLRLSGTGRPEIAFTADSPETSRPAQLSQHQPVALYHRSLAALHAGHVAVALAGFRKFLARYPHHSYADNVQYWIGEAYFGLDQFQAALRELRLVVERYPHGNKVPDAMLKIGLAHLARGERREGRQALEILCHTYPRHTATRLATDRLTTEGFAQAGGRAPATASLEAGRLGR